MIKAKFLKERYYRGKLYSIGSVIDMPAGDFYIYKDFRAVMFQISNKTKKICEYTYKELQELCKKNNLAAVGSRERLTENLLSINKL